MLYIIHACKKYIYCCDRPFFVTLTRVGMSNVPRIIDNFARPHGSDPAILTGRALPRLYVCVIHGVSTVRRIHTSFGYHSPFSFAILVSHIIVFVRSAFPHCLAHYFFDLFFLRADCGRDVLLFRDPHFGERSRRINVLPLVRSSALASCAVSLPRSVHACLDRRRNRTAA